MRILFVAMADSIHTARWINQISHQNWDIHVFDFNEGSVNAELSNVTTHTVYPPKQQTKLKTWESNLPFRLKYNFVRRNLPSVLERRFFPPRLAAFLELANHLKPDILHSLEMQHESYPLLEAKRNSDGYFKMPWVYSSWGSDIYHFINQPEHCDRIKSVLSECDYYVADCRRDVRLAEENGFKGETLGVFPTAGGYDVEKLRGLIEVENVLDRKTIALKGYHHWAGRALTALKALQLCADLLKNYTVEIYLADKRVQKFAEEFSRSTGVPVKIIQHAENVEILKLFGRSRISIGMSITDGTPNTMLEAMIMGAFPIQSDTVSTAEWITSGRNGFLVSTEDVEMTAQAITRALKDDRMIEQAAVLNKDFMINRIDRSIVQPQVINMYKKVFEENRNQQIGA